jgi:subtilisin family serine protease
MNGNGGKCKASGRIAASADFTKISALSLPDWTKSLDLSADYAPGSKSYKAFQKWVDNSDAANPDVYGHGTHVASIAAGQSIAGAPDATGLAPGATIVDLKVLDENGVGSLGDVLAAIDWAVANRKQYNIRVLNLSLSTPTAGSFVNDPLCKAVRAATSLGMVVVVAAGNSGQSAAGNEVFGAMGAPAIEPSVITVGSANAHDTLTRNDAAPVMSSSKLNVRCASRLGTT